MSHFGLQFAKTTRSWVAGGVGFAFRAWTIKGVSGAPSIWCFYCRVAFCGLNGIPRYGRSPRSPSPRPPFLRASKSGDCPKSMYLLALGSTWFLFGSGYTNLQFCGVGSRGMSDLPGKYGAFQVLWIRLSGGFNRTKGHLTPFEGLRKSRPGVLFRTGYPFGVGVFGKSKGTAIIWGGSLS